MTPALVMLLSRIFESTENLDNDGGCSLEMPVTFVFYFLCSSAQEYLFNRHMPTNDNCVKSNKPDTKRQYLTGQTRR